MKESGGCRKRCLNRILHPSPYWEGPRRWASAAGDTQGEYCAIFKAGASVGGIDGQAQADVLFISTSQRPPIDILFECGGAGGGKIAGMASRLHKKGGSSSKAKLEKTSPFTISSKINHLLPCSSRGLPECHELWR